MQRRLATVVLTISVAWGCSRGPSFEDYRRLLSERAGRGAIDCGTGSVRKPEHIAMVKCGNEALRNGTPFFVAFRVQGVDSAVFSGLAVDSSGMAHRVDWDSDAYGGSRPPVKKPWIDEQLCAKPSVVDDARPIHCAGETP
jgi:hypothetical protein